LTSGDYSDSRILLKSSQIVDEEGLARMESTPLETIKVLPGNEVIHELGNDTKLRSKA
jgi:hypothetical protein